MKLLTEQAKPAFVDWLRVINVFIDLEEAMNQKETAAARKTAASSSGFRWTALLTWRPSLLITVSWWCGATRGIQARPWRSGRGHSPPSPTATSRVACRVRPRRDGPDGAS